MGFLKIEQETQISFNAAEDTAELYTADSVMIRKMNKLVEENPEQFQGKVHSRYQGETLCNALHSAQKICSYSYKR